METATLATALANNRLNGDSAAHRLVMSIGDEVNVMYSNRAHETKLITIQCENRMVEHHEDEINI